MTHFLAVFHDIESDQVYGIYDTLLAAQRDLDNRTQDRQMRDAQERSGGRRIGPSVDYGVDMATVEEWDGGERLNSWTPGWGRERVWSGEG